MTPMTSFQSSAVSDADTIDSVVVVADSSAAATFEEAAATGEGSAQPEGLKPMDLQWPVLPI